MREGLFKKIDYEELKESGMLWELFPWMTGDYEADMENFNKPPKFAEPVKGVKMKKNSITWKDRLL